MRVAIFGGTSDARAVATQLVSLGVGVVSSLAGRVSAPRLPPGAVRIGGFGGVRLLADWLSEQGCTHVIDATHPFAATMSRTVAAASASAGLPLLRLARPGWADHPDAAAWTWVDDYEQARAAAEGFGRPFLTTGRLTLPHFLAWADRPVLVRVVEDQADVPPAWTVVLDRGPYAVAGEAALLAVHGIDVLLTKDSGGRSTSAKLDAARERGVPVVVVRRPAPQPGVAEVADVDGVLAWLSV